ncbi:MAG TPA: CorA family divalent cation transporter, partial [Polyangia bacterium]
MQQQRQIPAEARELLLGNERHVHAAVIDGGLVAVLSDLNHDFHTSLEEGFDTMGLYLDERILLTTRRHPLETADQVRRDLRAGVFEPTNTFALFEHFLERLADTQAAVVRRLADQVDDAEDEILTGRLGPEGERLGRIRRGLARVRRQLNANRAALSPLPRRLPAQYDGAQRQAMREAIERHDAVAQDLELVQERARLAQEEIGGRLTEATNRNLFLLSIVTTTLLPITLITGIFGMNVGGLPWLDNGRGFWWVILLMMAA